MQPKIGHIKFLNVLPLTYGYENFSKDLNVIYGVPTFLNDELKLGRLDISAISAIEYARQSDDLMILPKICVRANKNVKSIILVSKRSIDNLQKCKIILSAKSATGRCLLKVILKKYYSTEATYETRDITAKDFLDEDSTAALLIGDDALYVFLHPPKDLFVYDLGAEWFKLTGQQMVYALWVVKKTYAFQESKTLKTTYKKIVDCFFYGFDNKDKAIKSVLSIRPFSFEELDNYLGGVIKWDLNSEAIKALNFFYSEAMTLKFIDAIPELTFCDLSCEK